MDFEQHFISATTNRSVHHFKDLIFTNEVQGKAICGLLNSSLYFAWFLTVCNGRNIASRDVDSFPIGELSSSSLLRLGQLFDTLMESYRANSVIRVRKDCELQEFRPGLSKPTIDLIDEEVGKHFGFNVCEIDFIQNYEVKYRMGSQND